jgi:hypothetical protein
MVYFLRNREATFSTGMAAQDRPENAEWFDEDDGAPRGKKRWGGGTMERIILLLLILFSTILTAALADIVTAFR